jgi:hypothetical protein
MDNPVNQSVLGTHAEEFMVCQNRPDNDADWADASKAETASMAGPDPVTSAAGAYTRPFFSST